MNALKLRRWAVRLAAVALVAAAAAAPAVLTGSTGSTAAGPRVEVVDVIGFGIDWE